MTITTVKGSVLNSTIEVDTINEATAAAGVTVDGVLLKDGGVTATAASSITASSGTALRVTNTGSGASFLVEDAANPDSTPFVIDQNGRMVQGHTEFIMGGSASTFEQHSTNNYSAVGAPNISVTSWSSNGGFAGGVTFDRSVSGTVGNETTVANGTNLGSIYWRGTDGSGFLQAAQILGEMDADPAGLGVDMPGRLSFRTTAVGSASPSERMCIDSAGNVGVGTASPDGTLHVHSASAGSVTANAEADNLVVENSGNTGISVLSPDANYSNFYLGSPTDSIGAYLRWRYSDLEAKLSTSVSGAELALGSGNGAEAMRIDSDGNIGIGQSTPTAKLHVTNTGSGDSFLVEDSANPDSSPFVIDASGNVVVGNTAALAYTSGTTPDLQVNAAGPTQIGLSRWSANSASNAFIFLKSRGAATGTHGAVLADDELGKITWYGSDGTSAGVSAASILAEGEGTFSPTSGPGRLVFATTASGATSVTERMRIDSSGNVGIGVTPTEKLDVNGDAIRIRTSQTPASASATGDAGQICWDANYIYVCVATNTWVRAALATW